jgi:hypothetical protein
MQFIARALPALTLCVATLAAPARADLAAVPTPGAFCGQEGATGSLAIGAVVGSVEVNGVSFDRKVSDINALTIFESDNLMGSGPRYVGSQPLGWVYRDEMGAYWLQVSPGAKPTKALSAEAIRDELVHSFGVSPAAGTDSVPIGNAPGTLDDKHVQASPCFEHGDRFFPHEALPGDTAQ